MLCTAVGLVIFALSAEGYKAPEQKAEKDRADIILIDTSPVFGRGDKPPVAFPHDRHTEIMAEQK